MGEIKHCRACGTVGVDIEFCNCITARSSQAATEPADVIGKARARGAIDYINKVKVGDNPYDQHDARHWAWMEGFATAGLNRC